MIYGKKLDSDIERMIPGASAQYGYHGCNRTKIERKRRCARATANLVAAAPAMLAALEVALTALAYTNGRYQSQVDQIRAAIAKAKGETA